jgi:phosphatidate cytidylyltransferase
MFMKKNMQDLKRRLVVSLGLVIITSFLVINSQNFWVGFGLTAATATLAAVGIWEYFQLAKAKGLRPKTSLVIFLAIAFIFIYTYLDPLYAYLLIVFGFYALLIQRFKKIQGALADIASEFFGLCYLVIPLSMMLAIVLSMSNAAIDGRLWFLYLLVVTKITDVAGYFIGRLFGSQPLAQRLSPKKTIEGSVAGFIASVATSCAFGPFIHRVLPEFTFDLPLVDALILGVLIASASLLGDLAESLLKRDAIVKDSNRLPGVGGILDLLDSLLFSTPIVYFYLKIAG